MNDFFKFFVPVVISIVTIIFNAYQLHLRNKQFLFDKRIILYQKYKNLLNHQNEANIIFRNDSNKICDHGWLIGILTNDSELESTHNGWETQSLLLDDAAHKAFLSGIEKIRNYGMKCKFVFNKYNKSLYDYFNKYADLLHKTYEYRNLMRCLEKQNRLDWMKLEDAENKQKDLHKELIQIYKDLCKISDSINLLKLEKSITLNNKR